MRLSSQRILPFVLVVTLALCMAPSRALGVTDLLAEIMKLVLGPFAIAGNQLGQWLRPASLGIEGSPVDPAFIQRLQQERDEFERLYVAEQARVDALTLQLQQLQMGIGEQSQLPVQRLSARVAVRSPIPLGVVTLNHGSNDGVHEGVVAVYNGVNLLGRVQKVSALQCDLLPLANASTGLLDAAIFPKDHHDLRLKNAARVQLTSAGDGTLVGDIDRGAAINIGDEVRLFDQSWPPSAQGMIIGSIEKVAPKESEPLRNTMVVRPQYQVSQVSYLTLKIELESGATQPAPGPPPATGGQR